MYAYLYIVNVGVSWPIALSLHMWHVCVYMCRRVCIHIELTIYNNKYNYIKVENKK